MVSVRDSSPDGGTRERKFGGKTQMEPAAAASKATRLVVSQRNPTAFFKARHPRTCATLTFGTSGTTLLELNVFKSTQPSSILLLHTAQAVLQDGRIFLATPIDPLFFLLPLLENARGASEEHKGFYKPLSECFNTDDHALLLEQEISKLPHLNKRLSCICDINDNYDEVMVRLNDEKVISWLRRKTCALSQHLETVSGETASQTAASSTSDPCQFEQEVETIRPDAKADFVAAAIALVSEYLRPPWTKTLVESFGISYDQVVALRQGPKVAADPMSGWRGDIAAEKLVAERGSGQERVVSGSTKASSVAPRKGISKLQKGQKTMASFFSKK